jgi:hypothetical protein
MRNTLAAFVIGRRSIAAAVFAGPRLEFHEVRSFQAKEEQAASSITTFVNQIIERCGADAAGIELLPEELATRTAILTRHCRDLLSSRQIFVLAASEENLFQAYASPPLRSRALLRQIALKMFPQLRNTASDKELLDAVILGLHLQTERMIHEAEEMEPEEDESEINAELP